MTKTSKKQLEYANNYLKKFDEIKIRVPKGKKEIIKNHADSMGESMNAFIDRAIRETIDLDIMKESEGQFWDKAKGE